MLRGRVIWSEHEWYSPRARASLGTVPVVLMLRMGGTWRCLIWATQERRQFGIASLARPTSPHCLGSHHIVGANLVFAQVVPNCLSGRPIAVIPCGAKRRRGIQERLMVRPLAPHLHGVDDGCCVWAEHDSNR